MIIELVKFGTTLTSRQSGKEALAAFQPVLREVADNEKVIIDFSGVITFTPSWGDEFLTQLQMKYGSRLFVKNTSNPSVKATIKFLEEVNKARFNQL